MSLHIQNPDTAALAPLDAGMLSAQPTIDLLRLLIRVAAALCLRAWRGMNRFRRRIASRCELAQLDERTLRDVGLRREQVIAEIRKGLWEG